MKQFLLSVALMLGLAAPAQAEGPMLVELFASKNCRACPGAYKTLSAVEAKRGDDIIVLTWAVDYWDYLGGKELMALPESKDRQRGYVERFGLRGPYTPQSVYNGVAQTSGNKPSGVGAALKKADKVASPDIRMERSGQRVTLTGEPGAAADVLWITYLAGADNTTKMPNPVTGVRQIGPWSGGKTELSLPDCVSGCLLVVQEAGVGRVLATMRAG